MMSGACLNLIGQAPREADDETFDKDHSLNLFSNDFH
jgi:hypothetical protein